MQRFALEQTGHGFDHNCRLELWKARLDVTTSVCGKVRTVSPGVIDERMKGFSAEADFPLKPKSGLNGPPPPPLQNCRSLAIRALQPHISRLQHMNSESLLDLSGQS
jgi:hypothetical protein